MFVGRCPACERTCSARATDVAYSTPFDASCVMQVRPLRASCSLPGWSRFETDDVACVVDKRRSSEDPSKLRCRTTPVTSWNSTSSPDRTTSVTWSS